MISKKYVTFLLLVSLPVAAETSLEKARRYFERSQSAGIPSEKKIDWLLQSIDTHPTFKAHYELGKIRRQEGEPERALHSFRAAFDLSDQPEFQAQAAYQLGITHHALDRFVDTRHWLRTSLSLDDHPSIRNALRKLELSRRGKVQSAEEILRELRVTRSFEVSRAELRVHFEINRASLDEAGRLQAQALGEALSGREAPTGAVYLLGHTDRLCPRSSPDEPSCDDFNLGLSQERAAAVRRYLRERFGLSERRVEALGCGRHFPMSREEAADDHFLNRRVVVTVSGGAELDWDEFCGAGSGLF